MFKSLLGVIEDVATIAAAPVEIAADLTKTVTAPIADVAREITGGVKELLPDHPHREG